MTDKSESDLRAFSPLRDLQTAVSFLTRLPVGHGDRPLFRAAYLFPLVGAAIGAVGGAVYWAAAALGLGGWVAALLAVAVTCIVTGALHEDGLADTADGFGGGTSAERRLEIMRDPRTGAFGVLALVFATGLKVAALAGAANAAEATALLIVAHAGARGCLPVVMWRLPTASGHGLAASAGKPDAAGALLALAMGLAAAAFLLPAAVPVAVATTAVVVWLLCRLARHMVGGYNGDVLGAIEQVAEIGILLAAAAVLRGTT